MEHRDRASGWKHAKLSGHKNEELLKNFLDEDKKYRKEFLKRINCKDKKVKNITIGGLHETDVENIIPGARKTKSKTDMKIFYDDNTQTNISIKKSLSGQVYFVRAEIFIECFEKHFDKQIPEDVKRAIKLFWASADDALDIIEKYKRYDNEKNYKLQVKHKSLNANILKVYDKNLYEALLKWFIENAYEVAFLSFASGAAKNADEWSDYIWYKNLIGENKIDDVFDIRKLCKKCSKVASKTTMYGSSNGGTTIQLPFGFVQWHQKKLQFHHDYSKISDLMG